MRNKDEILSIIFKRFPNHRDFISELFTESESFRTLCEDYFDCKVKLDEFISARNEKNERLKEYKILLEEIEDELLERIMI